MIYTFLVGKKLRSIRADKLVDAVQTVCSKYFYSTASGKSFYICSNDPLAPSEERHLKQHGIYGMMELAQITPEQRKEFKI